MFEFNSSHLLELLIICTHDWVMCSLLSEATLWRYSCWSQHMKEYTHTPRAHTQTQTHRDIHTDTHTHTRTHTDTNTRTDRHTYTDTGCGWTLWASMLISIQWTWNCSMWIVPCFLGLGNTDRYQVTMTMAYFGWVVSCILDYVVTKMRSKFNVVTECKELGLLVLCFSWNGSVLSSLLKPH